MGNRAVITFSENRSTGVGIYLHFLDAAKARGFRDPASDPSYAMARLCGLIHEFFGVRDSCSLGVGLLSSLHTDNWDNGVYVVGKDWTVVNRWGKGAGRGLVFADLSAEAQVRCNEMMASLIV